MFLFPPGLRLSYSFESIAVGVSTDHGRRLHCHPGDTEHGCSRHWLSASFFPHRVLPRLEVKWWREEAEVTWEQGEFEGGRNWLLFLIHQRLLRRLAVLQWARG